MHRGTEERRFSRRKILSLVNNDMCPRRANRCECVRDNTEAALGIAGLRQGKPEEIRNPSLFFFAIETFRPILKDCLYHFRLISPPIGPSANSDPRSVATASEVILESIERVVHFEKPLGEGFI